MSLIPDASDSDTDKSRQARWLFLLMAILWGWLVYELLTRPAVGDGRSFGWSLLSNGGHAFVFAILSLLMALGLPRSLRYCFGNIVMASTYGAFLELMQSFEPSRHADIYDWVTDTVGAVLGLHLASAQLLWAADRGARWRWLGQFVFLAVGCFLSALLATLV